MRIIKLIFCVTALLLVYNAGKARAQVSTATVSYRAVPSTALATGCPAPSVGFTIYCEAADKYQISANGAAYVVVWPSGGVAGVTSVAVNGGTPQTGAVALTIPTKATSSTTTTIQ